MTRRRSQKRYRVTYATMNASTGKQNDPKAWCNTNDEAIANATAVTLCDIPNVAGSYVYDRDLQSIIVNYGQEITDHA